MIEINLIPDVKQQLIKAQRVRTTVISFSIIISLAVAALVVVLAIYVYGVQTVRGALSDSAIKTESETLSKVEDLSKVLTIQNQLTKISDLNAQKKIDSRLFDVLDSIIPPAPNNIQVSTLSINADDKSIVIEGQAPGSYAALEVFKKTLANTQVRYSDGTDNKEVTMASKISTTNVSFGEDSSGAKVLRFTIGFNYAEELFAPTSQNVSLLITGIGNATDSYLGVPKKIFAERAADLEGDN